MAITSKMHMFTSFPQGDKKAPGRQL